VKDDAIYLGHIRDAIADIANYTAAGRDEFMADRMRQDAVIRKLEIIGEAVKRLSDSTKQPHRAGWGRAQMGVGGELGHREIDGTGVEFDGRAPTRMTGAVAGQAPGERRPRSPADQTSRRTRAPAPASTLHPRMGRRPLRPAEAVPVNH
jgi:hypothetical protein